MIFVQNADSNLENNIGILTVNSVDVLSVEKVDNSYAPKVYPELMKYFSSHVTDFITCRINDKCFKRFFFMHCTIFVHHINRSWLRIAVAETMSLSVSAMAADVQTSSNEAMVIDYLESINSGNWDNWVSYYAPDVQEDYQAFVSNDSNLENNIRRCMSTYMVDLE